MKLAAVPFAIVLAVLGYVSAWGYGDTANLNLDKGKYASRLTYDYTFTPDKNK
jgi:hypothetical protein